MFIHNIRDMKILHTIRETPPNPRGLCALSINSDNCFLAYPGSNITGESHANIKIAPFIIIVPMSSVLQVKFNFSTPSIFKRRS